MIKSWELFLESKKDVSTICKKYGIKRWSIKDGLVDVDGDVNLSYALAIRGTFRIPIRFGKVNGDFLVSNNRLTSLLGCPKEVSGRFNCGNNQLTSLEGCPLRVDDNFNCSYNYLTNLKDCPKEVGGLFYCENNRLISLEGLSAKYINAESNPIKNLSTIGQTMIDNKISYIEAVIFNIDQIPDNELILILNDISAQKILEQNNFRIFNLLRIHFPEKWAEVMKLRDVDLSADLGELGF